MLFLEEFAGYQNQFNETSVFDYFFLVKILPINGNWKSTKMTAFE